MEVAYEPLFDEQQQNFRFCFTCEECAHFDEESGLCTNGFPNEPHLSSRYNGAVRPMMIVFCKEFELA